MSSAETLREAQLENSRAIQRHTSVLLLLWLVALLLLGFPDSNLLKSAATASVPVLGAASFKSLLFVVPLLLLAVRLRLDILFRHEAHLTSVMARDDVAPAPVIATMNYWTERVLRGFIRFALVPSAFVAVTYKAMVFPWLGAVLLGATAAATGLLAWLSGRAHVTAAVAGPAFAVLVVVSMSWHFSEVGVFRRPFELNLADLSRADLENMDLRQGRMARIKLDGADLSRARLDGTNLSNADLRGAHLRSAVLAGADLRRADLSKAGLLNAELTKTRLRGADLREADLQSADLTSANLWRADLGSAELAITDLSDANLWAADLSGTDLRSAILRRAFVLEADLSGSNLSIADLRGANLRSANLSNANLRRADLSGAVLFHADLSGTDLGRSDLSKAYLVEADLSGADLGGADLSGAVLRGSAPRLDAALANARLTDACGTAASLPFGFRLPPCPEPQSKAPRPGEQTSFPGYP